MTAAFDRHRDQQVADETSAKAPDASVMCPAKGCPYLWSVQGDKGRACSAHYGANPRDWPRITQQLLEAETERARRAGYEPVQPQREPPTKAEKLAALEAMRGLLRERPGLAWALRLAERDAAGEALTPFQLAAYTAALTGRGITRHEGAEA